VIGDDAQINQPRLPPPPLQTKINPNTAPWWELTVLPGVGPTAAQSIVDYRRRADELQPQHRTTPVFTRPADLAEVHGIGPKTVTRIGPYLTFDTTPQ